MRLYRSAILFLRVLPLVLAAGALHGQSLISLGESSSGSSSTCALSGGGVCTLSALVTGISPATVTWNFSPTVSGAVIGTPTGPAPGLTKITYTAPNPIVARQTVTVTATTVDGKSAQQFITLVPVTVTVQVSPSSATLNGGDTQQFTAKVLGVSQTDVVWSISPQVGTIDSNGLYTAPSPVTTAQKVTVTATSTFDPSVSGSATVNLNATAAVGVTISPATATLTLGGSQQFTATVSGSANNAVTWSISPQVGTISANGLYVAPPTITSTQKITVTATSVADATKSGTAIVTLNTLLQVGDGAPGGLPGQFLNAFYRNGFNQLVSLPPLAAVRSLGSTGYVQEFADVNNTSGVKLALVTANMATAPQQTPVYQLLSPLYAYYTSVGVGTAGYPTMDTLTCPAFDPANACLYDIFDKGVALFSYTSAITNGTNFSVTGTFYTEWVSLGGMNGPGRATSAQTANLVAAPVAPATTGTSYTVQAFGPPNTGMSAGAIYSVTSGVNKGKIFGVIEPLYDLYVSLSGPSGGLGLPTSEALQVSNGVFKQTFEGGALQYTSTGGPTLLLPVASVRLSGATPGSTTTLNLGQTVTLTATPYASDGSTALSDRPVSWTGTNSRVITIQANGPAAVITAVGAGAAAVQASSQGIASGKVNFVVIAPCCQIGDGAPATVQQAFQDALTRNKIAVQTPVPSPAGRVAAGYVQMVQSTGGSVLMLAQADGLGTAYVISGPLLARYQSLGGPSGTLGYPRSDAGAGGTQLFANNAALAGNPVRVVSGVVLSKWALLGYETGGAGLPQSEAAAFITPGVNSGQQQAFAGGTIFGATAGPRTGQAYLVGGLILARYNQLGGPAGDLGMPVSEEFAGGAVRQQNFENGNITYSPGDTAAAEHLAPRTPSVIVAPSSVSAGGRVRLAVAGFANNSTLRVSLTGEPDFMVNAANGAYSWEMAVPLTAKSGTVSIHAADTGGAATADGVLTIKGFADNRIAITKVQGDNQTGLPGAMLPLSLRVALADSSGSPVVGATVTFQAAPGAAVSAGSVVTDNSGRAETYVRLPATEGTTAVNVSAPGIAQAPVTFFVKAAASTLAGFPSWIMAGDTPLGNGTATIGQKGALLTGVAAILSYHQNRGELRAPNGQADPATLNSFLTADCTVDVKGAQLCDGYLAASPSGEQIVNLWRVADFTGGVDVIAYAPSVPAVSDLIAQGSPVLLSLALSRNGAPAGGHFVVATGIAPDGSIVIQDPNPWFAQSSLNSYLNGFNAGGAAWTGVLRGVVQFALRAPSATRFLVGALSQPATVMQALALNVQSAVGGCGISVEMQDSVDAAGNPPAGGPLVTRLNACDGLQSTYQIAVGAGQPFHAFVTDLASAGSTFDVSGSVPATYQATRSQLNLVLSPQTIHFTADAVVNAATFTPGIAPGGIVAIFGSGLAAAGGSTAVDFDGVPASVLLASPFQVNAVIPPGISPGSHTLHVQSAYGTAQQTVSVSAVAPAIFQIGTLGAVTNQDNTLNSPSNPAVRGQVLVIYCTGLGATAKQGQLSAVINPVSVVLNGHELSSTFAGETPGVPGLYQVNVLIPADTPPGLSVSLALKQGAQLGNVVNVAFE